MADRFPSYDAISAGVADDEYAAQSEASWNDEILQMSSKKRSHWVPVSISLIVCSIIALSFLSRRHQGSPAESLLLGSAFSKAPPFKAVTHPDQPTSFWGSVSKPYPTGAFWTNLAVKNGDGPIGLYPYGIKAVESGIHVSFGATRRIVSNLAITDPFAPDLQISASQPYLNRAILRYDNISVTMGYKLGGQAPAGNSNGVSYEAYLVKSSPFVTVVYNAATPVITAPLMKILNVEARVVKGTRGVQYIVTLGNYQKWLVYCSEPVALVWNENTLASPSPIQGVVRVAILPNLQFEQAFAALLKFVDTYPTGASMSITPTSNTVSTVNIRYITKGSGPLLMLALPHHIPLLFPATTGTTTPSTSTSSSAVSTNEVDAAAKAIEEAYSPIWSIKGKMRAVVGDHWELQYTLPQIGWNYEVNDKLTNEQLDEIARHLILDVKSVTPSALDVYSFAKEIGRMARLALIGENLGIAEVRQQALTALETALQPWLTGANPDAFAIDKIYGGLVTTNGIADQNAEFGSGWYSDHHFHYGYFISAGAALARLDPPFFAANRAAFDTIVRDVCNYDATDTDFPFARHKDFFDGHSWASGLFIQANGKGQESSSEAVNAYYGAYLYGLATADADLTRFAHTLLSMEVHSVRTYWHMHVSSSSTSSSSNGGSSSSSSGSTDSGAGGGSRVGMDKLFDKMIYDDVFAASRMVGNIGALDVTATTWFGAQVEYVHGINIMPLSPATALLLDCEFVQQEFPVLATRMPAPTPPGQSQCSANSGCNIQGLIGECCPTKDGAMLACCDSVAAAASQPNKLDDEWKSLVFCDLAVVDRDAAWSRLLLLNGFGSGNSKSNSLFWAASRSPAIPGFLDAVRPPDHTNSGTKSDDSGRLQAMIHPSCSANSACDAIGMSGDCCPTPQGLFLGCCPKIRPSN